MRRFFGTFTVFLLVVLTSAAQVNLSSSIIFINEIGFEKGNQPGFIELVLVDGSAGIAGWTLDNLSNANFQDNGKIGFSSNFPSLPAGTPIIIYDQAANQAEINSNFDYLLTNDGFYQLPFNSDLLLKLNNSGSSFSGAANWDDFLAVNNGENGLILRDASGATRSSATWTYMGVAADPLFAQVTSIGTVNVNAASLALENGCENISDPGGTNGGGFSERPSGTPGRYNSWDNRGLIQALLNGNQAVLQFSINCAQVHPDVGQPVFGSIKVEFVGGIGPYTVEFTGPTNPLTNVSIYDNHASLHHASSGNFTITVTDSRGCRRQCSVFLADQGADEEICEGEPIPIGRPLTEVECGFRWEPETGLLNPDQSQTLAEPEETTTYQLITSNGEGGIAAVEEYEVKVNESPEVIISPDPAVTCGEDVELSVDGEWASYSWSIPYPTNDASDQASVMARYSDRLQWPDIEPVYSVTVTDENGCTGEGERIVMDQEDLIVTAVIPNVLYCGQDLYVFASTIPESPNYNYSWSSNLAINLNGETSAVLNLTGEEIASLGLAQGSEMNFTVTISTDQGCSAQGQTSTTFNANLDVLVFGNKEICQGESTTLSISENYSGVWSTGESSNAISITSNGTYSVTAQDAITGCQGTAEVEVLLVGDLDNDGVCDSYDCDPDDQQALGPGSPCNDYNSSTINDVFDENCQCVGEPDPDNDCAGNDIDGDGICDDVDVAPFNPCEPNSSDTDSDGLCDVIDCFPDDFNLTFSIGDACDDGNTSTINDVINTQCLCEGEPDPNNPCEGNDIDGDGICDDLDVFPDDPCNGLTVAINGDLTLCADENETILEVSIENGVPPYSVLWNTTATSNTITAVVGTYNNTFSVSVTDALSCTVSDEVEIIQYEELDEDGDGKCEDEACDVSIPLTPNGLVTAENNLWIIDEEKYDGEFDCDLAQDYSYGLFTGVLEYVELSYSSNGCFGPSDPIQDIVNGIEEIIAADTDHALFGKVVITNNEFLCSCSDVKDGLIAEFDPNGTPDPSEVGIWINFGGDPILGVSANVKSYTIGFPEWATINNFLNDITDSPVPGGGTIHPSQMAGLFIPQPNLDQAPGVINDAIQDFAFLDSYTSNLIQQNSAIAAERFKDAAGAGYQVQFITSADCSTILPKGEDDPKPSAELAKAAFDENTSDGLVVWVHRRTSGEFVYEAKINGVPSNEADILDNMQFVANTSMDILNANAPPPEFMAGEQAELNMSPSTMYFGTRNAPEFVREKNFFGHSKEIGCLGIETVTTGTIPDRIWKPDGDCLYDTPGLVVGGIQGAADSNPIVSMLQMLDFGKSIAFDPEVRKAVIGMCKEPLKAAKQIVQGLWEEASGANGPENQQYIVSQAGVTIVIGIATGTAFTSFIAQLGKKTDDIAQGLKNKIKDFPENLSDEFYTIADALFPDEAVSKQFLEFLGDLGEQFRVNIINNPKIIHIWDEFRINPNLNLADFELVFKTKFPLEFQTFFDEFQEVFLNLDNGLIQVSDDVAVFIDDLKNSVNPFEEVFQKSGTVKAWQTAIGRPLLRKDAPFLEKLSEILEPSVLNKLPNGQADLDAIVAAIKHPCCGTTHPFMKNVADHLDDVKHLVDKFSDVDGFDQVVVALKNPNFHVQDGASHMLTKLKGLDASQVSRMEGKIVDADNLAGICSNCLFDIELTSGKKLELKSYSESTIGNIANSTKFKNQFKAYLADANNMDGFEYIFSSKKIGNNSTLVKDNFKSLFQQGNYSIYDEVFAVNQNIFSSIGINSKGQFIQAVNNTSHDLYKFIDIF